MELHSAVGVGQLQLHVLQKEWRRLAVIGPDLIWRFVQAGRSRSRFLPLKAVGCFTEAEKSKVAGTVKGLISLYACKPSLLGAAWPGPQ